LDSEGVVAENNWQRREQVPDHCACVDLAKARGFPNSPKAGWLTHFA